MLTFNAARLASSAALDSVASPPGQCWLEAGQALSLQARQGGRLQVLQGRLWVTFSNAARDGQVRSGDHVLLPGQSLALSAGDAVVIESWATGGQGAPASVRWEPAPRAGLRSLFQSIGSAGGLGFALRQ